MCVCLGAGDATAATALLDYNMTRHTGASHCSQGTTALVQCFTTVLVQGGSHAFG